MEDSGGIPGQDVPTCAATPESAAPWRLFRKKPIEVRAYQFSIGMLEAHLFDGAPLPEGVLFGRATYHKGRRELISWRVCVMTAHEQRVALEDGDWIIPEPRPNRFYPVKPDIFARTYVLADASREAESSPPSSERSSPGGHK